MLITSFRPVLGVIGILFALNSLRLSSYLSVGTYRRRFHKDYQHVMQYYLNALSNLTPVSSLRLSLRPVPGA